MPNSFSVRFLKILLRVIVAGLTLAASSNLAHAGLSKFADHCENLLVQRHVLPASLFFLAGSILAFPFVTAYHEAPPGVPVRACASPPEANVDVDLKVSVAGADGKSLGHFRADPAPGSNGCLDPQTKYAFVVNAAPPSLDEDPDADMAAARLDFEASGAYKMETVYRYVGEKGHYFSLSNTGAGVPATYGYEGEVFSIYLLHYPGTMAISSCMVGEKQFLSVTKNCEGQPSKGKRLGFIFSPPSPTLRALYRLRDDGGDYIADTQYEDLTKFGYTVEGILGYVP